MHRMKNEDTKRERNEERKKYRAELFVVRQKHNFYF